MPDSKKVIYRFIIISSAIVVAVSFCYLYIQPDNGSHGSKPSSYELESRREADAEARIQNNWRFSDFALSRMPEVVANGSWSVSSDMWWCNTELFSCEEVDFRVPEKEIKSVWILSYYKNTSKYCCTRILTDTTKSLFVENQQNDADDSSQFDSPQNLASNQSVSSIPLSSPVELIRTDYAIDLDHVPAHTGRPLPSDGSWSSSVVTDKQMLTELCFSKDANCDEVSYKVPELNIACTWVLADWQNHWTVVEANPNARFYFVRIRDLK